MLFSKVLVEPVLLLDNSDGNWSKNAVDLFAAMTSETDFSRLATSTAVSISASLEDYLITMIESCATEVLVPSVERKGPFRIEACRSMLSASLRKRVHAADTKGRVWKDICHYFHPILEEVRKRPSGSSFSEGSLERIARHFYRLALAGRKGSDVVFDPQAVLLDLRKLDRLGLRGEGRARLALIAGVMASYSRVEEVDGLKWAPSSGASVGERLDEILEDAYLLEASRLRRFLGAGANLASVKRDLRMLMKTIVRTRNWAKGLFLIGQQLVTLPSGVPSAAATLDGLASGALLSEKRAPIAIKRFRPEMGPHFLGRRWPGIDGGWSFDLRVGDATRPFPADEL